ncbi:hypothetical protein M8818_002409 [Zalaria obscura]|uniref:Uncharacterized protein n=1 Tax=Zalaria obscura TaxID=2024903 RepID=A0ACC3SKU5_9PEZI
MWDAIDLNIALRYGRAMLRANEDDPGSAIELFTLGPSDLPFQGLATLGLALDLRSCGRTSGLKTSTP